ncbi:hypothetical protein CS542_07860 [Pedobacter sp. IW39]|nr:hypothetical protein CS542_07860 [Pedobacter sp. IW39]
MIYQSVVRLLAGLIAYTIAGDCKPASITGTINVRPDVTIALTSAVKRSGELCVNTAITEIEYQVTNVKRRLRLPVYQQS